MNARIRILCFLNFPIRNSKKKECLGMYPKSV